MVTDVKELSKKIYFSGPDYRGAAYPPFAPEKINIKNFPDNVRPKDIYTYVEDEELCIRYYTQEPFRKEHYCLFKKEIVRAIKYLLSTDVTTDSLKSVRVHLNVEARDGKRYGNMRGNFTVKV